MSTDYYATFSPIHEDVELLIPVLEDCLFEGSSQIDHTVDRFNKIGQRFEYTYETKEFKNFKEAFLGTTGWDGVELHFLKERKRCSLLLWRDSVDLLTINFCEPGKLFEEQLENYGMRLRLGILLRSIMDRINSPFCILEAESSFTTRTKEDIVCWIENLKVKKSSAGWSLVICEDSFVPNSMITEEIRKLGSFYYAPGSRKWLFSFMGKMDYIV